MPLSAGDHLGPYEILAPIGAGGMGEVFRANDTRLHRTVAIKVLPHDKVADPDRKRRFLQEARAASALNHPHIVTVYDIASDSGIDYLVMEYLPGQSLDKLITPKGLPVSEAVNYAAQIAAGLAAAHAAGIVHRDMKPGNVIVSPEGQIKILDFGLAKLSDHVPRPEEETLTQQTQAGSVVGTVAYMSPEQAGARSVDHRTDIFSLGVILYEMLGGHRPFQAKSSVEIMSAIINNPAPPLSIPPRLAEVLERALEKDPKARYQHAGDLALDLSRSLNAPALSTAAPAPRNRWITVAALLAIALPAAWWLGRRQSSNQDPTLSDIAITPLTSAPGYNGEPTISPDDQTIAYVSDRSGRFDIYLRQIGTATDIALTHDQGDNVQPSFSPDGRQIAFVSSRNNGPVIFYPCCDYPLTGGDIWVMSALGGSARRVVQEGNFPVWSPDGSTITFVRQRRNKLYQVPAGGGDVKEVPLRFAGRPPVQIATPNYSGDGRWIFFASQVGTSESIYAVPAAGGAVLLLATGRHPAWNAATQSVLYVDSREGRNNSLWELPFSTVDGKTGAAHALTIGRGRDWRPAVSSDGKVVAYTALQAAFNLELVPFDAEAGKVLGPPRPITSGSQIIYFMRFSPDGHSIVFQSSRGAGTHIWRLEIGQEPVQLTSDPNLEGVQPAWSPNGSLISFSRSPVNSPQARILWFMAPDGGNPQSTSVSAITGRWLPDNSGIVYIGPTDYRIFVYDLASKTSRQLPGQTADATMPNLSADGKWVVYQSVAPGTGAGNIDVGAIPMDGGEGRVVFSSPHQEFHPFLSHSGRWLYFQWEHKNLYRVPGPAQSWQKADPAKITNFPESAGLFLEDPQISPDGKQLLYSRANMTADVWIIRRGK